MPVNSILNGIRQIRAKIWRLRLVHGGLNAERGQPNPSEAAIRMRENMANDKGVRFAAGEYSALKELVKENPTYYHTAVNINAFNTIQKVYGVDNVLSAFEFLLRSEELKKLPTFEKNHLEKLTRVASLFKHFGNNARRMSGVASNSEDLLWLTAHNALTREEEQKAPEGNAKDVFFKGVIDALNLAMAESMRKLQAAVRGKETDYSKKAKQVFDKNLQKLTSRLDNKKRALFGALVQHVGEMQVGSVYSLFAKEIQESKHPFRSLLFLSLVNNPSFLPAEVLNYQKPKRTSALIELKKDRTRVAGFRSMLDVATRTIYHRVLSKVFEGVIDVEPHLQGVMERLHEKPVGKRKIPIYHLGDTTLVEEEARKAETPLTPTRREGRVKKELRKQFIKGGSAQRGLPTSPKGTKKPPKITKTAGKVKKKKY